MINAVGTLNGLWGILIGIIPLLIALMFARRYNFVHGLITLLLFSCLMGEFSKEISELLSKIDETKEILSAYTATYGGSYMFLPMLVAWLASTEWLSADILDILMKPWVLTGIVAVIFVISQIFSSIIRKQRINKTKRLVKRAAKY